MVVTSEKLGEPITEDFLPKEQTESDELKEKLIQNDAPGKQSVEFAPAEGDMVSITIGKETYSPAKFHTFEVGPMTRSTLIRKGETMQDAYHRIRDEVEVLFRAEFDLKIHYFRERAIKARQAFKNTVD